MQNVGVSDHTEHDSDARDSACGAGVRLNHRVLVRAEHSAALGRRSQRPSPVALERLFD
jgi:hypothetical protein